MHLFEELAREVCGPNCVKILKLLEGKENVSEFILSEQMEMNINELRTMLYKLTEKNLLTSIRKKDKQKGWYVYYWTFNFRHARDLLIKHKEKNLEELRHKLKHKEIPKYVCPHGCVSLKLEEAMEIDFKCPECNSLLKLREVKYNEEVIRRRIEEIEEELDRIRQAIIVEIKPKEKKVVKRKVKKKVKKKTKKKVKKKTKKKTKKKVKKKTKKKKVKKKIKKKKVKKKAKKTIKKKVKKAVRRKPKPKKKVKKKPIKKQKPKKRFVRKKPAKKKKPVKKIKKKPGILRKIKRKIRF
tara:strand:- start:3748 stop:4638 length:891 start_codon:yes stop_codon:yes gene_type:complete